MKSKHVYVTLIDLPEALPFEQKKQGIKIEKIFEAKNQDEELFNFVKVLEKNLNEELSYIGEDLINEKFYKRFLFSKNGFLEIMYQAPAAIIAHFIDEKSAKKFASALKKTVKQTVKDGKLSEILQNLVEIKKESEDQLTYEKWSKITKIRKMV